MAQTRSVFARDVSLMGIFGKLAAPYYLINDVIGRIVDKILQNSLFSVFAFL
jgi:hypothetical protein